MTPLPTAEPCGIRATTRYEVHYRTEEQGWIVIFADLVDLEEARRLRDAHEALVKRIVRVTTHLQRVVVP